MLLAAVGFVAVGGGAFVGPPRNNRVEIAYFTQRESNASTKILQRLGFKLFGDAQDPDAGEVWEWRT